MCTEKREEGGRRMTVYVCSAEECRLWRNFNFFPLLFGFGQKDVKEE